MRVIGTAGHVDHGKSTLVRRLTGTDPDRLEEEKVRGMTIDLGFAWLRLPSGAEASIVDVPGHERFVKNMLAGAAGVDVALLVVAADEGVMPQTREHVDILDLLGVQTGVVALTKTDLVDDELLSLVSDEVTDLLLETSLRGSPVVPVSAVSGRGIDELLAALDVASTPPMRPLAADTPYLPVDRAFSVAGFGTVVTGTLHRGQFRVGDEVEILPAGHLVRIRGLQTHGQKLEAVGPGTRVAVNVSGIGLEDLQRGDVLAPFRSLQPTARFDAFVRVLQRPNVDLAHGARVSLHIGTSEQPVTLSVLGGEAIGAGEAGWVQVRAPRPLVAVKGQPFVLRLPAPVGTIAGGEVVDINPRHRRSDRAAIHRLNAFRSNDPEVVTAAVLADGTARDVEGIVVRSGLSRDLANAALEHLSARNAAVKLNRRWIGGDRWRRIVDRAQAGLSAYHAQFPLRSGMPREELRSKVGVVRSEWPAALDLLSDQGVVRLDRDSVSLPEHRGGTSGREQDVARVLQILSVDPYSPPSGSDLLQQTGVDEAFLAAMTAEGLIVRASAGLYFTREAYCRLVTATLCMIDAQGSTSVGSIRDAFNTSRKYALAFLEHLDAEHVTRRMGDARVRGSKQTPCA